TDPNWTFTGNYATNTATAGRINGNYTPTGSVIIPGYPAAEGNALIFGSFAVIGWSANAGRTLPQLQAFMLNPTAVYFYGMGAVASNLLLGGAVISPTQIF